MPRLTFTEATAARAVVLYRLIVRPLAADPVRALLTVAAVALGVAVIVAVDLASEASMGSFRSSLESLEGSASYEITQVGGIPEARQSSGSALSAPVPAPSRTHRAGGPSASSSPHRPAPGSTPIASRSVKARTVARRAASVSFP